MTRLPVALLLVIGLAGSTAGAQTGSMLIGTVTDSAGAVLSGATLTLEGERLSGDTRTARSSARGVYRFPELPAGVYNLTASLNGLQTVKRTSLRLAVGSTLTVDVVLARARTPDVVTITGAPSAVDVTTPASTTGLSSEDLMNLPIGGGAGILQIVPGVTPSTAFGSGIDTSQLTLDGGPATVPVRNTESAAVHPYWMEEVQIAGLGANAEYGVYSGLTANIALRSGSQRFSGLVEYRVSPSGWVGDNTGDLPEEKREEFRPNEVLSRWNGHALIGGPIAHGRLFFFSGFEYAKDEILQAASLGDVRVPRDERLRAFITNLTWVPSRNLRVEGFLEGDETREVGMVGLNALPETANDRTWGIRSGNARAVWTVSAQTLLEVRAGAVDFTFEGIPAARRAGPAPRRDDVTGINSGNVQQFQDIFSDRFLMGATVTRFLDGFGGRSHTLKSGAEIEHTTYRQATGIPGGRRFTDEGGVPKSVMLWEGDRVSSTGIRTTVFLQDAWSLARRVTIHPGLRLSLNRGSVADKGSVFRTNPLSPRIGVAWDVSADHTTVIRGSYGRLHEGLYTSLFNFMNTAERHPMITADVVGPDVFKETNRTTVGDRQAIDDDLAHAYADQYLVGIERELFPDFSLVLQYVRRNFGDIWALTDTGSRYEPVQRRDPGPDGQRDTPDDGALLTVFNLLNSGEAFTLLTNPDQAFRRYDAVQAIGQKRFSGNWQLLGAYTWSRTHGNVNPTTGANRAGGDTSETGVFFNPNRAINAAGPVSADFAHQLDLQVFYALPAWGGLGLSAAYRFLSGGAAGRTAVITGLRQGRQTVRVEPRGTSRVDSAGVLDVRIEKTFPVGRPGPTLGIYVDLLNAMNGGVKLAAMIDERSGETFGDPTAWADPRTVRIAARLRF